MPLPALAALFTPAFLASAGLALAQQQMQRRAVKKQERRQNQANQRWTNFQEDRKDEFQDIEDSERAKAKSGLDTVLDANTGESRLETIGNETDRLSGMFTGGLPSIADEAIASGQEDRTGGEGVFDKQMAAGLANATAESRKRLQALARSMAYGGGSQFGQGRMLEDALMEGAMDINAANQRRANEMGILRRWQTVEPEKIDYEESPLVPILGLASGLAAGLGGSWADPIKLGGAGRAAMPPKPRPTVSTSGVYTAPSASAAPAGFGSAGGMMGSGGIGVSAIPDRRPFVV